MVCPSLPDMCVLSLSILLVKVWLTLLTSGEGIRMIKHNLAEGSLINLIRAAGGVYDFQNFEQV